MSTIFILKEILDLLYEETKRGELVTTDVENRLRTLEKHLEEKNKEISKLYTENIRLENTLRKYETEFELLSNMPIIPIVNSDHQSNIPSDNSKDNSKEKIVNSVEIAKKEDKETKKEEKRKLTKEEKEEKRRKHEEYRKEYLKEYQRKYRQMKKEKKMEMNV